MDRFTRGALSKGFGIAFALLLALTVLTFQRQDPTLTNLVSPQEGIGNWLGIGGALLGGTLVELVGASALLLPLLALNWLLAARRRPPLARYLALGAIALLTLAGLHGLATGASEPSMEAARLTGPGLAGTAIGGWFRITLGPWLGGAALAGMVAYLAGRLLYVDAARTGLRDARTFLAFGLARLALVTLASRRRLGRAWRAARTGGPTPLGHARRAIANGGRALRRRAAAGWITLRERLGHGPASISRIKALRRRQTAPPPPRPIAFTAAPPAQGAADARGPSPVAPAPGSPLRRPLPKLREGEIDTWFGDLVPADPVTERAERRTAAAAAPAAIATAPGGVPEAPVAPAPGADAFHRGAAAAPGHSRSAGSEPAAGPAPSPATTDGAAPAGSLRQPRPAEQRVEIAPPEGALRLGEAFLRHYEEDLDLEWERLVKGRKPLEPGPSGNGPPPRR